MIYTLCVIATSSRTRPRPLSCEANHTEGVHVITPEACMESTQGVAWNQPQGCIMRGQSPVPCLHPLSAKFSYKLHFKCLSHTIFLNNKKCRLAFCLSAYFLLLIICPQILICAVVVILGGISVISAVIIWGVIIVVVADVIIANI